MVRVLNQHGIRIFSCLLRRNHGVLTDVIRCLSQIGSHVVKAQFNPSLYAPCDSVLIIQMTVSRYISGIILLLLLSKKIGIRGGFIPDHDWRRSRPRTIRDRTATMIRRPVVRYVPCSALLRSSFRPDDSDDSMQPMTDTLRESEISQPNRKVGSSQSKPEERDLFIPLFTLASIAGFTGIYAYEMLRLYSRGELYLPF